MNININKDDSNINDFLYVWHKFGDRPSKYAMNIAIDPELFDEWINKVKGSVVSSESDYFPSKEDESVLNRKMLYEIDGKFIEKSLSWVFISLTHFDVLTGEDSVISEVNIYYLSKDEECVYNEVVEKLLEFQIDLDEEEDGEGKEDKRKVYTLSTNSGALEAEPLELKERDFGDIKLYYNDGVVKKVNKLLKNINESQKGIGLIYGPRGCGKTNLINYIIQNSKKNVVIIPICFVDFIINPEFRSIVKKLPDTLFIIDDSEVFITEMNAKSNIYISNLVQLVDGIQSDIYPVNILCVSNLHSIDEIDINLLECNHLLSCIECGPLTKEKAKDLCEHLDKKFKVDEDFVTLSHILNKSKVKSEKKEIGF